MLLEKRFRSGKIYTYVGDILISVNPLKQLGLYDEEVLTIMKPLLNHYCYTNFNLVCMYVHVMRFFIPAV